MINETAPETFSPLDFLVTLGTELKRLEADFPSFLYIIQSGDRGPVKIGHAARPSIRVQELQIGCPIDLALVAVIAVRGPGKLERLIHERAKAHKVRGEWFDLSPLEAVEIGIQVAAENDMKLSPMHGAFHRLALKNPLKRAA